MQTAIDQPTAETQKHEVPQNPFTDAIGTEMNTVHNGFWSYGWSRCNNSSKDDFFPTSERLAAIKSFSKVLSSVTQTLINFPFSKFFFKFGARFSVLVPVS